MPSQTVRGFLDASDVQYRTIPHPEAFTASETAAAAHVPGSELAKTVIVKLDSEPAMLVLPSTCRLDMERVRTATGSETAQLATEEEFRFLFPDCELGAMPPLGKVYRLPVYVCQGLTQEPEICFNGGSHRQLVRMAYAEFAQIAEPIPLPAVCGTEVPRCESKL